MWRRNEEAERLAWLACVMAQAVASGIAAAFGDKEALRQWRDVRDMKRSVPGYTED